MSGLGGIRWTPCLPSWQGVLTCLHWGWSMLTARRAPRPRPPEVTVILLARGPADRTGACLRMLARQTLPRDSYEVICVGELSDELRMTDEPSDLQLQFAGVTRSVTPGAARNKAVLMARGAVLLFLSDTTVRGTSLVARHWRVHSDRHDLGLVFRGTCSGGAALEQTSVSRMLVVLGGQWFPDGPTEDAELARVWLDRLRGAGCRFLSDERQGAGRSNG